MLRKLGLFSAASVLFAVASTVALAQFYGPPVYPYSTPMVTAPSYYYSTPYGNHYSPYGSASPYINNARPEGSGTNPYLSGVGTSGHAPLR